LESQSFSPSNPPRRAKNLRFHGKTPINNDVIDVELVGGDLRRDCPSAISLNRVPPVKHQFGGRRAFMQLLKASALLPAVESAAWRSQSEASRLSVLGAGVRVSVAEGIVLVSAGGGVPPLSTGAGE